MPGQNGSGNKVNTVDSVLIRDDGTAPVITLNGASPDSAQCTTGQYQDPGATAVDAFDGVVSVSQNSVNTKPTGSYTVTYTATDAAGNSATATRTVTVVDTQAPVLTLAGSANVQVNLHANYVDAGALASDACEGVLTAIKTGAVNTALPGQYTVCYNVADNSGNTADEVCRTVTVVDSVAPVVTLTGSATVTIECGGVFNDPGATATDDPDGALAVVVSGTVDVHTPGTYTLTYTATDGAGNSASKGRNVIVADTANPSITLNGANPMTVQLNASFTDPGASAADTCDSQPQVVLSGSVNTSVAGTYTLTYTATDASGNSASATRTVNVTAANCLEGDLAPKPDGNGSYTSADIVQERRYVAGLDIPGTAFQSADCAPLNTKGNGVLASSDLVQVRRFVAALDTAGPCAGPSAAAKNSSTLTPKADPDRIVTVSPAAIGSGTSGTVSIVLASQGNETSLSFSVDFDPSALTYVTAAKGSGLAGDAALTLNTNQTAQGRLGVVIDQSNALGAGNTELLVVTFTAHTDAPTTLDFGDVPVTRSASDASASDLPIVFTTGVINAGPEGEGQSGRVLIVPNTSLALGVSGSVPVMLNAQGDETSLSFSVDFDASHLLYVNAVKGSGLAGDAALTLNTSQAVQGRLGVVIDQSTPLSAGQRQVLVISFTPMASGNTNLNFGSAPVTLSASDATANDLQISGTGGVVTVQGGEGEGEGEGEGQGTRNLSAEDSSLTLGAQGTVAVTLQSQGDETSVSFSVDFDPLLLVYVSASKGSALALDAAVTLNINQVGQGRLGVVIDQGTPLVAGEAELLLIKFAPQQSGTTTVDFGDAPVTRSASDASANDLILSSTAGTVTVSEGFLTLDQNQDNIVSLSELLRVIQFYNSGGLYCANPPSSTEDGYAPGPGQNHGCVPYSADYNPQDWFITLAELLRCIQFYNSGGYHYCPEQATEDGYCPGI